MQYARYGNDVEFYGGDYGMKMNVLSCFNGVDCHLAVIVNGSSNEKEPNFWLKLNSVVLLENVNILKLKIHSSNVFATFGLRTKAINSIHEMENT